MSMSIFRIFGILVLALLVFFVISKLSGWNDPVAKTSQTFMTAVQQNDLAAVKAAVDPKMADVVAAGNKIVNVHFKAVNAFQGAFSSQPDVHWTYSDLTDAHISTDIAPEVGDKLASVTLVRNGAAAGHILLHRKSEKDEWKIFYMSRVENEGSGK